MVSPNTQPTPNTNMNTQPQGNTAPRPSRREQRREQRQNFYRALSARILLEAGVEVTPVEVAFATDASSLKPRGRRQTKALEKGEKLSRRLGNLNRSVGEFTGNRHSMERNREAGYLRWEHVTEDWLNKQKAALRVRLRNGEIDDFEFKKAVEELGEPSGLRHQFSGKALIPFVPAPHHKFRLRELTPQERAAPLPIGRAEMGALHARSKVQRQAVSIAAGSARRGIRRKIKARPIERRRDYDLLSQRAAAESIDWSQALDPGNLIDLRARIEDETKKHVELRKNAAKATGVLGSFDEAAVKADVKQRTFRSLVPRYLGLQIMPEDLNNKWVIPEKNLEELEEWVINAPWSALLDWQQEHEQGRT